MSAFSNIRINVSAQSKTCIRWSRIITFIFSVLLQHGTVAIIIDYGEITEFLTASIERHF